ncbi:LacI family transcriptional regulator (plasmid) [Arthrobacter sp. StoSoilB3]|nr:LacI family transcriptional regulator [Arthrobacter sp. StoSoilB3]
MTNTNRVASAHARKKKSSPTIYDIAQLAGVSTATVSRAFSNPGRVSAKTLKIITDIAKEVSYEVNPLARALPTGRTLAIGLIVADFTNPTFFDIIRGAESRAAANGYALILAESRESDESATTMQRLVNSVDGLVLANPRITDEAIRAMASVKPVTVINREITGVPCIVPDVKTGISDAVRTLAAHGHTKITYIAAPEESWMSARRWFGVQEASNWSKIDSTFLTSLKPTVDGGRQMAREVLKTGATAVIAYSDLLAIGLMQELQAGGVVVPDQMNILGFDDILGSALTTPGLTTIRSPLGECGSRAVAILVNSLRGLAEPETTHLVGTELVVRGSSGRLLLRR